MNIEPGRKTSNYCAGIIHYKSINLRSCHIHHAINKVHVISIYSQEVDPPKNVQQLDSEIM